ncbi:diacylglycerol/lipid kinase family protein [Bacillus coahuilensis]|nr:diacylglycerol kinase family protein [Bacillus coahuilensis]
MEIGQRCLTELKNKIAHSGGKKMYQHILLLVNGQAGKQQIQETLKICLPPLLKNSESVTVRETKYPSHIEEICKKEIDSYDLLIAVGGDGTVHESINGIMSLPSEKRPPFGIIPSGTANDLCRGLGLPLTVNEAVDVIVNGHPKPYDVVRANDRHFINFLGVGLITETSQNVNKQLKETLGKLSYYVSAFKTVTETAAFSYQLRADDEMYEGEAVFILVANGKFVGGQALPFDQLSLQDGWVDIFLVKEGGFQLVKEFLQAKTSVWDEKRSEIQRIRAKQAVLKTGTEQMEVDMDGEVYMKTPIDLKVLPEPIYIIR